MKLQLQLRIFFLQFLELLNQQQVSLFLVVICLTNYLFQHQDLALQCKNLVMQSFPSVLMGTCSQYLRKHLNHTRLILGQFKQGILVKIRHAFGLL